MTMPASCTGSSRDEAFLSRHSRWGLFRGAAAFESSILPSVSPDLLTTMNPLVRQVRLWWDRFLGLSCVPYVG